MVKKVGLFANWKNMYIQLEWERSSPFISLLTLSFDGFLASAMISWYIVAVHSLIKGGEIEVSC